MRIATWNVNSVRTRAERIVDFLHRHDIDVLAMQETKVADDKFPYAVFEAAGYEVAHVGFHQWNGVAIVSRVGLSNVSDAFPHQPKFAKDGDPVDEARAVGATCGGVRVWSLYVPNGRDILDPHYDYKLDFLYQLSAHVRRELAADPAQKLLVVGDFNVAPRDEDVWDISIFEGKTHVTEPERAAFQMLEESGLTEITRPLTAERYTYWDYKSLRFQKGEGMRIDFQLASAPLADAATSAFVDVEERGGKGASDHAPVVVEFNLDAAAAPAYDEVR
ncbi:exodeoxyribonuclease III [Corynebacterium guangdongense]|uniref:Exodeoxyribonuclease-3 n=1 Tax=Corynebacterium guangdongense TaxID=1783348 RepID=A0ABU1ZZJ0_9CORY|nr:exodeoxyribonuclease III [Corynebacterium guangdongense]MDR7330339.1 exodeoxyribonuclease-3 [Corynebacterium guangdongense]WJZ18897.1 Exodeoxyribonuclease III [Corynebacterium guangdongense]